MSAASVTRARSAASRRTATGGAVTSAVPRRVSGAVGGRVRGQPRPQKGISAGARALSLVRSLPDHSLIDRLVRGRAWIPVLGVLLTGIVAMQVEILKAGSSLGRSLERTASLQSQNESLQAGVAGLAESQRIERVATQMGMVMPSPGLLTFVAPHPQAQLRVGTANIHAPDPAGFASQLTAQIAAAELVAPSTAPASSQANQTTGGQSASTSGSATAGTVSGATTSAQPGTSPSAAGPSGAGATGAGSSGAGATGVGSSTTGAQTTGATTGAPSTTVTPSAGAGASTGAAGLPATPTSQSGNSSGG